jgi:CMP-N,N'-diacetyllegionaminic acid synthase
MKILVVIPARGGSKGVLRKNVLPFAGLPLFVHSVLAAQAITAGDVRVVVSSDDMAILMRAAEAGAVGMVRPEELATDTAATDDVLVHVLQELQLQEAYRPDLVVLLQPTVPVRRPGLVDDCIDRLVVAGADSLLTAYPLHFVWWRESGAYRYDDTVGGTGRAEPEAWRSQCDRRPARQQMEARELMYHEDGAVYVTRAELLERTGKRLGGRIEVFEVQRSIDIDRPEDFALAEALYEIRAQQPAERQAV